MEKKLFVLFLLFTVFVNLKGIREEVSEILFKSFYFPFIYSRNLFLLLSKVETQSIELNVENQRLREKLYNSDTEGVSTIKIAESAYAGEILQYIPLGIPEEIVVKINSPKAIDLVDGTVVDLGGFLVGRVEAQREGHVIIKTIYNESFRVGVESIHPYYTGILQGGEVPLVLYIPVDAEIRAGDTIYTSQLSSYAKPYIPVGVIIEYQRDNDNPIFYRAKIEPFFKPFTSRIVIIHGKSKN